MKIIQIITLFPDLFSNFITTSIIKNAINKNKVKIQLINLRDFSINKHRQVDDYQYGGGAGMVLMAPVVVNAIRYAKSQVSNSKVILLTPQGESFKQKTANNLATIKDNLIFICGHYEGFDERIRYYVDLEISIGDYVLTSGEVASMVLCDAIIRLISGVIQLESYQNDSFMNGYLDYPIYTKPLDFEGLKVPDILLTGHHKNINLWRKQQAFYKTWHKRPDLIAIKKLTTEEKEWVKILQNNKTNK